MLYGGWPKFICAGAVASLLAVCPCASAAEAHWIRARYGPFEAISDDGRKPAVQALSQFVEFSFALGTVLGQPDLKLDPPIRIMVFKSAQDLAAHCPSERLRTGRDRTMACAVAEGQLARPLLRDLTARLIENNFPNIPGNIESGLETFFSTMQSNAVHVTWGAPPAASERTRDWALIHRIVTGSDYSGKAKIYLHNLASGMDRNAAIRNALGEDAAKFEADVDQYFAAGNFVSSPAPSRPLNPDRDINSTMLTSDEGELARADLLTPDSAAIYQALLKAGKHVTECNEGLGLLALEEHATVHARPYFEAALKGGSKNVVALTEYAIVERDPDEAIEFLKAALTIDPKYALAHWTFGEKLSDQPRRMMEWKQAVALAPRNYEWAAQYAQLCLDLKQYAEAGRGWMAAALAAPTPQLRDQYLAEREKIDQQRLAAEDEERRKAAEAKARELADLKAKAQKELADLEARANTRKLTPEEAAHAVDWYDSNADATFEGTLVRVDCAGKGLRLSVKNDAGTTQVFAVKDPSQLLTQGGEATFSCGVQKARKVRVAYKVSNPPEKGVTGEATGLEFD
ncbi:MAG TPA: hypothetical protein VEF06_01950 [Bryobacteraceae bacterium]|nr:hypothetical protein [Bryobacteraceae bacterium]